MKKKINFEKIPLLLVYKQGNQILVKSFPETNNHELYGFLKLYIEKVECKLYEDMTDN